jgi:predicted metalloprotease
VKRLSIILLACAAILPLGSAAQATAYPVKSPALTASPLYDTGPLPVTECAEPPVKRHDRKVARAYLNAVVKCLENTWEWQLTRAALPYSKVKVRYLSKIPKDYCGFEVDNEDSQSLYCDDTRTIVFQLGPTWLDDPTDLWMFETAAAMYAGHVQKLTGIYDAYEKASARNKSETFEHERRVSLQTECLAGAFVKSVWPMKARTNQDWTYFLSLVQGDSPGDKRWWGKTATLKTWIKRGFATGDPASCNTWAASSSEVA